MKRIELEQGCSEWHQFRKNHIGSSDAPVIMGVSPWKTPYQLWLEKLGLNISQEKTQAMQRGIDLEPLARHEFQHTIGIEVKPAVFEHVKRFYIAASVDGISDDGKTLVEIKIPGREDHEAAMDGIIPPKYLPQLPHQMEVCGLDSMWYFSYNANCSKALFLEKDEKLCQKILEKEEEFWNMLQSLEEPALMEKDWEIRIEDEWIQKANAWKQAKEALKAYEEQEDRLRRELIVLTPRNSIGAGIKISKSIRKGTVDYKMIPELKSVDLERYRKAPIETWRLTT